MPVLVKLTHYHFPRWRPKCIVGTSELSDARETPQLSTSLLRGPDHDAGRAGTPVQASLPTRNYRTGLRLYAPTDPRRLA
jgi:hypothetical protein